LFFFCIRNWVSTAPNMGQMGVKDMTDPSENPNHPKESQRNLRGPPGKRCAELAAANSWQPCGDQRSPEVSVGGGCHEYHWIWSG
jgi:hypothetical protein